MPYLKHFKAWIIFFILSTIGGLIVGVVAGGLLGAILGLAHVDLENIRRLGAVTGFIVGVPVSFILFQWTVERYVVKPLVQALEAAAAQKAAEAASQAQPPVIVQ